MYTCGEKRRVLVGKRDIEKRRTKDTYRSNVDERHACMNKT